MMVTALQEVSVKLGIQRTHLAWSCHVAVGVLTVAHFVFLMCWFAPAIHQPDANGYFAGATRIATTGRTWYTPESPLQYANVHWLKTEDGRYFSHYPPGFGVVLALPFKLFGPAGAMVVNPLMCSLTLVGLYLLCVLWVGPGWGLLAAALMAVNPSANHWALGYFAHTAVAFFLVWGLFFLAKWERTPSWRWAVPAGLFFGILPAIRYPAALFTGAATLFATVVLLRRRREVWRSALAGLIAAAVPLVAVMVYHTGAFGAFWKTGYSLTNEQTGFAWDYFTSHATSYLEGLSGGGAGLLFGVGLVGIAVLSSRRTTWRYGAFIALLVTPVTVLYMAYYWGGGRQTTMSMRFLVPTFYVFALAAVWMLAVIHRAYGRAAVTAAVALVAVTACWGIPQSISELDRLQPQAAALATIAKSVEEHVPPGSLVIANGQIQQHLEFVGKWRLVDERVLSGRTARGMGRRGETQDEDSDQPRPMQREKSADQRERYGDLRGHALNKRLIEDLRTWAGDDRKIYWLVPEAQFAEIKHRFYLYNKFTQVTEIELTEPEVDRRGMRGPGAGGHGPPDGAPMPARFDSRDRRSSRRSDMRGRFPGAQRGAGRNLPAQRNTRRRGGMGRMGGLMSGGKLLIVEWDIR